MTQSSKPPTTITGIEDLFKSKRALKQFISAAIPLTNFIDVYPNGTTCCPFHEDSTPSAKIFNEKDGSQKLYCFTEHKMYSSYDYIVLILKQDPKTFLLSEISEEDIAISMRTVDFSFEKTESTFSELINDSAKRLPDMDRFLSCLYSHAISI